MIIRDTKKADVRISLDWLTLRQVKQRDLNEQMINEALTSLLPNVKPKEWRSVHPRSDKRTRHFRCRCALKHKDIFFLHGHKDGNVYAVLSGSAAREFVRYYETPQMVNLEKASLAALDRAIQEGWNVDEIHIAFDDFSNTLPLDGILAKSKTAGVSTIPTEFRGAVRTVTRLDRDKSGKILERSVFFGSPDCGTSCVRIYDKDLESQTPEYAGVTRVEQRCKGAVAHNLAKQMIRCGLASAVGELTRCLQFVEPVKVRKNSKRARSRTHKGYTKEETWPVSEWWSRFTKGAKAGKYLGVGERPSKRSPRQHLMILCASVAALIDSPTGLRFLREIVVAGREKQYGDHEPYFDGQWQSFREKGHRWVHPEDEANALAFLFPIPFWLLYLLASQNGSILDRLATECEDRIRGMGITIRVTDAGVVIEFSENTDSEPEGRN